MHTILEPVTHTILIQRSKFITILFPLETEDIQPILNQVKEQYPKANHYCYGYRFHEFSGVSDAGEPSGTAGMPILNVLQKQELDQVLAIVVRYFGGIKLGANGLVRAYSTCISEALKKAPLGLLVLGQEMMLEMNYETYAELKKYPILIQEPQFEITVSCLILVTKEEWDQIKGLPFLKRKMRNEVWIKQKQEK